MRFELIAYRFIGLLSLGGLLIYSPEDLVSWPGLYQYFVGRLPAFVILGVVLAGAFRELKVRWRTK